MADAKIIIEALSDNTGIKDLATALAEAQQKLKETRQALKDAEKSGTATAAQMKNLRAEFNQQKLICGQLNGELKKTAGELTNTGSKADDLKNQLKTMISDKLGVDLDSISSKFTSVNGAMLAVASAAAAITTALVQSSRDLSSYSNQFIAFAGNANQAKIIYDEFNKVYRATNYDEQKVYDMGKSFLALGMNAKEASALVMECADAAAGMGKGVEEAEALADAFKRLYTGGELTDRQLKKLAESGVDLSDVQDEIKAGGMEAYEALKGKLEEYAGSMDRSKQTSAEMEGDIKANLIEIGRQTAELIDEMFGFSEALRGFYSWLIEVTNAVVESIKNAMAAFAQAQAGAKAYSESVTALGDEYDEVMEAASQGDEAAIARLNTMQEQAKVAADIAEETEAARQEEEKIAALETERPKVNSIVAPSESGGGGSSGGGGGSERAEKDTTDKEHANGYRELQKSQQQVLANEKAINDLKVKGVEISQEMALIGVSDSERIAMEGQNKIDNLQAEMEAEQALHQQKMDNYAALAEYLLEYPFDGSDKILENLTAQQEQEAVLFDARIANYEQMIELAKQQRDYDIYQDSTKLSTVQQQWEAYAKSVSSSMATAVSSVLTGEKSMGQALAEMAKSIISNAITMLAQWVALVAILAAFGDPTPGRHASIMMFGNDGTYVKGANGGYTKQAVNKRDGGMVYAAGGAYITGAGSNRSDSIPAMLSNGEFVLNASAVNAVGADNLARINAAGSAADGLSAIGSNVTLNVSAVDASGFSDFLSRGGLQVIKQALYNDDRSFGAATVW